MKQKAFFIFFFHLLSQYVFSQNVKAPEEGVIPKSISIITVSPGVATGDFSATHSFGISALYQRGVSLREKKATFTLAGLLASYAGKKQKVSDYVYTCPAYTAIATLAGISYSPARKITANLLVGPGLTIYNRLIYFAFTGRASFHYKIKSKFLAGVSFTGLKTKGSTTLFVTGVSASFILP
jgi:hypothetical protein